MIKSFFKFKIKSFIAFFGIWCGGRLVLLMRSWIFATGPSFGCSCFFGRGPDFFLWVLFLRAASCTVHCPRSAAKHTAFWSSTSHHHSSTPSILIINTINFWSSTPLNFSTPSCPWLVLQAPATQGVAQDLLFESSEAQVFVWLWYYNHYGLQRGTVSNPTEVALYIENYLNGQKGKMLK